MARRLELVVDVNSQSEFAGNITCRIPVASSSKKSKKMKYSPNKPFNKGIIKIFFKLNILEYYYFNIIN